MNIQNLNLTITELHHAAQLISIAGNFLAKDKKGTHIAMEYSHSRRMLVGSVLKADKDLRVALDISKLDLHILSSRLDSLSKFDLKGRTKKEGFDYLKQELRSFGSDTTIMVMETSYDIPDHPAGRGEPFQTPDKNLLEQHIKLRSLAKDILQSMARVFGNFSEILIWPNKFNTQMQIYFDPDKEGKMRSTLDIGLGVKDEISDQPYFFVNPHSEREINYPEPMPDLSLGKWHKDSTHFAYLQLVDLDPDKDLEHQEDRIAGFFSEAIERNLGIVAG